MQHSLFSRLENFRLRLHFSKAIQHLSKADSKTLESIEQQSKRQQLIERLKDYRNTNVFPRNSSGGTQKPYFFDTEKRACAVADLLIYDKEDALANKIFTTQNNALVEDMHIPELLTWAKRNGLSQRDLIVIQPTYIEFGVIGILLIILGCANLTLSLLYGKLHIKNILFCSAISLLLFFFAKLQGG